MIPIAYLNPLVEGRTPPSENRPPWPAEKLYAYLYSGMIDRPYMRCMIHMPAGWVHSMSGGQWLGMTDEVRAVYTEVIGRVLAEKHGYRVTIYGGLQYYTAHSIYGVQRGEDGRLPPFGIAKAGRKQDVRGMRDLTIRPWADIGASGWVFDSGSRWPKEVVRWQRKLRGVVDTVGLEAIPWDNGHVDWWACEQHGVEYFGLTRYQHGQPYNEGVPRACVGKAFVWLNHPPDPTLPELVGMIRRGWTPVANRKFDDLVFEAIGHAG